MAASNRDRMGQLFDVLAPALEAFIDRVIGPELADGKSWVDVAVAVERNDGGELHAGDPAVQLKFVSQNYPGRFKRGWQPFRGELNRTYEAYAGELLQVRHAWAHHKPFTDDDAYRALDTAERLLTGIGAADAAERVKAIRLNLRRVTADKDDRRTLKTSADHTESAGLRPWREVLRPHDDVATGNFAASEFAADLYKVATGSETDSDYADPVEFFRRTYLTEGLRDLMGRAVRRLSGDENASPVINLQTNFGGGKTHSMLSLWHLAAGLPVGEFPQDVQEVLQAGVSGREVRRVAIVGNHLSPSGSVKDDGTQVNTIWGELAWQLGGAEAFGLVARSDSDRTPPGKALHDLLERYAPAVVLIDEWVAYARSLVGRDDLAAGTFDDQFTFAQQLTEVVKGTPGVLLAISIPASESGVASGDRSEPAAGNALEVGGANGVEALRRLQNVVRRVADQWRPASSSEAYDIVKQRLFLEPDAEALAAIGATARAFVDLYRSHEPDFPREVREAAYEERIRRSYPIHPELFDTLYEEWSSLERFQRTRGVLRLMSEVVHALWIGEDRAPLIMPGSTPLASGRVNAELTGYLPDQWKAVIDADVAGDASEPARIDRDKPVLGQRTLTQRLARTVFFGAAPTIGSAHKGVGVKRVFLGTAVPGDQPGNFHSALTQLADRATYFYAAQGKYWYDLQANITRTAKDQAERLHPEDVWAEIKTRLTTQQRHQGAFAAVQVCPEDTADIPDTDETRLVVLHPRVAHRKSANDSPAMELARRTTEQRGTGNRVNRNMVVYLAADQDRLDELDNAVRDHLGWSYVLASEADLDLTQNQRAQATQRRDQASETVDSRLLQTYVWALVPDQPDPGSPFRIQPRKVEGQTSWLAERVSTKLRNDGQLFTEHSATNIRMAIDRIPAAWQSGHVSLGELWKLYCAYPYMPRLRDRSVLDAGVVQSAIVAFVLAAGYDEATGRYVGLWTPDSDGPRPDITDSLLLVRPEVATRQLDEERGPDDTAPAADEGDVDPDSARSRFVETQPGVHERRTVRFFGSKTLNPDRYAVDFKNLADEVIAHLAATGAEMAIRVEIEATSATGFDEAKVRTVSENAATLKFDQSGFEQE